jgi:rhodanese-related sulfurtransferase
MLETASRSTVRAVPAAASVVAERHFLGRLAFETDCADVHADLEAGADGIVVLDVRSAEAYAEGHVPGARSLPHALISEETTRDFSPDVVYVTYCWGPHCNGATRAAAKLASLGFQVKEMIGGINGWQAEGYELAGS